MAATAEFNTGRRPGASTDSITVRRVPFDAPWAWLGAGWRDLWTSPAISLGYGLGFALIALGLTLGLFQVGWQSLMLALAGGFLLVGPMMAVGLYELSRRYELSEPIDGRDAVFVGTRSPGQLAAMGVMLLILYFAWAEVAFLLFMLFMGQGGLPPVEQFVPTLLFTPRGLSLLIVGTIAGGLLALLAFSISVVSVPLLMTREIDVVTAVIISLSAVRKNPKPMALWAALIAGLIALGAATLFVGFVIAFPLIGHATWHCFRDVLAIEPETIILEDVTR